MTANHLLKEKNLVLEQTVTPVKASDGVPAKVPENAFRSAMPIGRPCHSSVSKAQGFKSLPCGKGDLQQT